MLDAKTQSSMIRHPRRAAALNRGTIHARVLIGLAAIASVAVLAGLVTSRAGKHASPHGPRLVMHASALRQYGHLFGDPLALVEVTEFSDFECPACAVGALRLDSLRQALPRLVRVRFRHYPLTHIHPHALQAAIAAECAARDGRFNAYHDSLFSGQARLGIHAWSSFANEAGVNDTLAFKRCMMDGDALTVVARDTAAGTVLQISGTPTLVIGDTVWTGVPSLQTLKALVSREALRRNSGSGSAQSLSLRQ
jgi:protein-disulfide isomerase